MRKFNKKVIDGRWITFPKDEEVQVKIKPFSLFSMIKLPSDEAYNADSFWTIFNFVVIEWKGLQSDEKDLPCDEENKRFVFDYDQEFALFVIKESSVMRGEVVTEIELKN